MQITFKTRCNLATKSGLISLLFSTQISNAAPYPNTSFEAYGTVRYSGNNDWSGTTAAGLYGNGVWIQPYGGLEIFPTIGGNANSIKLSLVTESSSTDHEHMYIEQGKFRVWLTGGPPNISKSVRIILHGSAQASEGGYPYSDAEAEASFEVDALADSMTAIPGGGYQDTGEKFLSVTKTISFNGSGNGFVDLPYHLDIENDIGFGDFPGGVASVHVAHTATFPSSFGNPAVGENEYVMVGGGYPFSIPCNFEIRGSEPNTLGWVRQNSGWTLSRSLPSPLASISNGSNLSTGTVFPQFRSDQGPPPGDLMSGLGFSTANGLPASNGDFGPRNLLHYLESSVVDTAPIEIFYSATVATHPSGGPPGYDALAGSADHNTPVDTPNYVFYYNQAVPAPSGLTVVYWSGPHSYWNASDPGHIHVGNDAHGLSSSPIFAHPPGLNLTSMVGTETTRGIDVYKRALVHEAMHKRLKDMLANGSTDLDKDFNGNIVGDGAPDNVEIAIGLDPAVQDSAGLSAYNPAYASYGDEEAICRMAERGVTGPITTDWASDGLNRGNPIPPNAAQRSVDVFSPNAPNAASWVFPSPEGIVP